MISVMYVIGSFLTWMHHNCILIYNIEDLPTSVDVEGQVWHSQFLQVEICATYRKMELGSCHIQFCFCMDAQDTAFRVSRHFSSLEI
jgi:hypothetical protein